MLFNAKYFYVSTGVGSSQLSRINAFDRALLDAGLGDVNLIPVSSVLPAGIKRVYTLDLKIGTFIPCVLSIAYGEDTVLTSGIAFGFKEGNEGGYVVEHSLISPDQDDFELKLKERLKQIGDDRSLELHDIETLSTSLEVESGSYGCAIAILVYLP